jgi:DNA polymerase delta subunit 1
MGSSQPSHFESEVLEKMTQGIEGLKHNNSEKDQHWSRPPLADFNPETDDLVFQQIEAEEGTLHGGGKATVKLFGVTEASPLGVRSPSRWLTYCSPDTPSCFMSLIFSTIYTLRHPFPSAPTIVKHSRRT